MKKLLVAGGLSLLLIVGILVVVLNNINSIIKTAIEVAGPTILQAPVTVRDVDVSFLTGSGEINGLKVGNPEGFSGDYAFYVDNLLIEMEVASIRTEKIHIKDVQIDSPSISFAGNLSDNNLKQLQRNVERYSLGQAGRDSGESSPGQSGSESDEAIVQWVRLDHLSVKDANISIVMSFLKGESLSVALPSLELADLGKEQDLTTAEVLQKIIASLNRSIVPLVRSNAGDIEMQLKEKREEIKQAVEDGVDKMKELFRGR